MYKKTKTKAKITFIFDKEPRLFAYAAETGRWSQSNYDTQQALGE